MPRTGPDSDSGNDTHRCFECMDLFEGRRMRNSIKLQQARASCPPLAVLHWSQRGGVVIAQPRWSMAIINVSPGGFIASKLRYATVTIKPERRRQSSPSAQNYQGDPLIPLLRTAS